MFVECVKCGSIYEIEQTLISPEGAKARCSVCGNVFAIVPDAPVPTHESPSEIEPPLEEELQGEDAAATLSSRDIDELLKELDVSAGQTESKEPQDDSKEMAMPDDSGLDKLRATEQVNVTKAKTRSGAHLKPYRFEPKPRKSYAGTVILLVLLFCVGAAGSVIYFAPEMIPWKIPFIDGSCKPSRGKPAVKLLGITELKGAFVDSQSLGRLFVIRGMVVNRSTKHRGSIMVRATILDDKGRAVRSAQSYAGNTIEDSELAKADMPGILSLMGNKTGKDNVNVSVAPGAAIPFMVVFESLPDNLSEFAVEPSSSVETGN